MIERLTHTTVRTLEREFEAALNAVAAKHGLTVVYKGTRFSPEVGTMKFDVQTKNDSGETITKEARDFARYAKSYGFSPDDLGREFSVEGKTYQIVGAMPRAPRYPILGRHTVTGQVYKFSIGQVKTYLTIGAMATPG